MTACHSNNDNAKHERRSAEELLIPASMDYTSEDSVKIKTLVEQFAEGLKTQNFAGCADLLYRMSDGEAVPYSEDEKKQYVQTMSSFRKIYDVRMTGFILRNEKNNDVKLTLQILENGNILQGQGTINISLNPVYVKGEWYLTLLDKFAEGVEDVYAQ